MVPMHHGSGGPSAPCRHWEDPLARNCRAPGEACVRVEDASWVAQACRAGLGGAEAWGYTRGNAPPYLWLHLCYDETVRWRVAPAPSSESDFVVEAFWVASIPNERLADRLRARTFAEARRAEHFWTQHDFAAWSEAERDTADTAPVPFAWPTEPCVGGPAEGDGGLPQGLLGRAESVHWRALSASQWRVYVRADYTVSVYGDLAVLLRRGIRLRARIDEARARTNDILWIRQPDDTNFYGNPSCQHCDGDGPCLRCTFCSRRGMTVQACFQPPEVSLAGPREYYDDLWTLQDLRVLPWGAAALF